MTGSLIWMSMPVCKVADSAELPAGPVEHDVYRQVYRVHGKPWTSAPAVGPVPDAGRISAEELALEVLISLLDNHDCNPDAVGFFVDCRSGAMVGGPAPTYRLALSAGMISAKPVCLWGQDGPETGFGISFLARQLPANGIAVLSACQRVVSPDSRVPAWTQLVLGDAAGAVLLRKRRFPGSLPVLAVQVGRSEKAGEELLDRTLNDAGLDRKRCAWLLVADPRRSAAQDAGRVRWPNVYFGVADLLLTLAEFSAGPHLRGTGAVLVHGRAGSSAVWVLGTEEDDD